MRSIVLLFLGFIYAKELNATCSENLSKLLDAGRVYDLSTQEIFYAPESGQGPARRVSVFEKLTGANYFNSTHHQNFNITDPRLRYRYGYQQAMLAAVKQIGPQVTVEVKDSLSIVEALTPIDKISLIYVTQMKRPKFVATLRAVNITESIEGGDYLGPSAEFLKLFGWEEIILSRLESLHVDFEKLFDLGKYFIHPKIINKKRALVRALIDAFLLNLAVQNPNSYFTALVPEMLRRRFNHWHYGFEVLETFEINGQKLYWLGVSGKTLKRKLPKPIREVVDLLKE